MYRFDAGYSETIRLANGEEVLLRPVQPEDKGLLLRGFQRLSADSRYSRFLSPRKSLTDDEVQFFTEIDGVNHFAIGASRTLEDGTEDGVAIARFIRLAGEPEVAEPAITIIDSYQGHGLGTVLLARLVAAARERGIRRFRCQFLAENRRIRNLLDNFADQATYRWDHELVVMEFMLPEPRPEERIRDLVRAGPMQHALRHAARGALSLHVGGEESPDDD